MRIICGKLFAEFIVAILATRDFFRNSFSDLESKNSIDIELFTSLNEILNII